MVSTPVFDVDLCEVDPPSGDLLAAAACPISELNETAGAADGVEATGASDGADEGPAAGDEEGALPAARSCRFCSSCASNDGDVFARAKGAPTGEASGDSAAAGEGEEAELDFLPRSRLANRSDAIPAPFAAVNGAPANDEARDLFVFRCCAESFVHSLSCVNTSARSAFDSVTTSQ